jgi:hypothetical protein
MVQKRAWGAPSIMTEPKEIFEILDSISGRKARLPFDRIEWTIQTAPGVHRVIAWRKHSKDFAFGNAHDMPHQNYTFTDGFEMLEELASRFPYFAAKLAEPDPVREPPK